MVVRDANGEWVPDKSGKKAWPASQLKYGYIDYSTVCPTIVSVSGDSAAVRGVGVAQS